VCHGGYLLSPGCGGAYPSGRKSRGGSTCIQENISKAYLPGSDLKMRVFNDFHSKEITGLSARAFHLFEDGVEQKIQHFSLEKGDEWVVRDNVAQHLEFSCTPKGIWGGSDFGKDMAVIPRSTHICSAIFRPHRLKTVVIAFRSRLTTGTRQSLPQVNTAIRKTRVLTP
jgi:hypothetical protein